MGYGDDLMVSGRARAMQKTDRRKVRIVYRRGGARWSAVWDHNPRIARFDEQGDFQELEARDANNQRPYHTGKTPERWLYNLNFRPDVGEIYLTVAEQEFAKRNRVQIVIEPTIKANASPNKQWGLERWKEFVRIASAAGFHLTQLGRHGMRQIPCSTLLTTEGFRHTCAVLANAKAYVGHEGGMHHAAAALGIPGVVIFGGFIAVETTGYALHRNLGVHVGEACGMRAPCSHCAAAMAAITPERVLAELKEVLR